MYLNIMFYVVYQQIQILIETKPCYSIINVNYGVEQARNDVK